MQIYAPFCKTEGPKPEVLETPLTVHDMISQVELIANDSPPKDLLQKDIAAWTENVLAQGYQFGNKFWLRVKDVLPEEHPLQGELTRKICGTSLLTVR